jgi:hypothetical protein
MIPQQEPETVMRNQYYYLYHAIMFFIVISLRMSYEYQIEYLYYYEFSMLFISTCVCYSVNWECTFMWMYIHALLMMQDLFDKNNIYLPDVFLLYTTVPLVLYAFLDDFMLYLENDRAVAKFISDKNQDNQTVYPAEIGAKSQTDAEIDLTKSKQDHKYTFVFVDLMTDDTLLYYNVSFFEIYIIMCSFLCVKGAGLMHTSCFALVYLILLWVLFAMTEKKKVTSRPVLRKNPSYISKVAYVLYSPPEHWYVIVLLICINITLIKTWDIKLKISWTVCILTMWTIFTAYPYLLHMCPML